MSDAHGPESTRREVLLGTGSAIAAGAAAVLVTRAVDRGAPRRAAPAAARKSPAAGYLQPAGLLNRSGPPAAADWTALRRQLSGHDLLQPGDRGYGSARLLFEPRFDSLRPAAVAYCHSPADVAACVSFTRRFRLPVRVRSGGHSYAGWSSVTGGLVIDVSRMHSFAADGQTVRAGTGIDLMTFYDKLASHRLSVPSGSCPTVGLAGITLGGGIGVLSRLEGVTSDSLEAVQIVTADGAVLDCDASQHADLLWACRGGGGGSFGVATSVTFRARPLTRLCAFYLTWPWSAAGRVLSAWPSWIAAAPDELWSNLHLSSGFSGGSPALSVSGTFAGSERDAASQIDRLLDRTGAASSTWVQQETYRDVMLLESGCATIAARACHTGAGGQLPRVPSYAKSDFFDHPLDAAAIRTVIAGIERMGAITGASGGAGTMALDSCGGAMNRISPDATAFVHRSALFIAQYSVVWNWPGSARGVGNQYRWLRDLYAAAHRYASGQAYQNYADPDLADWAQAYYGANYARLQEVKRTYDPDQLFRFPQSVRPA